MKTWQFLLLLGAIDQAIANTTPVALWTHALWQFNAVLFSTCGGLSVVTESIKKVLP